MRVFLGNFNKISDTKWQAYLVHNKPETLDDETLVTGIVLDDIPLQVTPTGKVLGGTFINPVTREVTYEYVNEPLQSQTVDDKVKALEMDNAQLIKESAKKDADILALQQDVAEILKAIAKPLV